MTGNRLGRPTGNTTGGRSRGKTRSQTARKKSTDKKQKAIGTTSSVVIGFKPSEYIPNYSKILETGIFLNKRNVNSLRYILKVEIGFLVCSKCQVNLKFCLTY